MLQGLSRYVAIRDYGIMRNIPPSPPISPSHHQTFISYSVGSALLPDSWDVEDTKMIKKMINEND